MRYAAYLVATSLLQGCYQTIDKLDLDASVRICGGFEKVYKLKALADGQEFVICANREQHNLDETK